MVSERWSKAESQARRNEHRQRNRSFIPSAKRSEADSARSWSTWRSHGKPHARMYCPIFFVPMRFTKPALMSGFNKSIAP